MIIYFGLRKPVELGAKRIFRRSKMPDERELVPTVIFYNHRFQNFAIR